MPWLTIEVPACTLEDLEKKARELARSIEAKAGYFYQPRTDNTGTGLIAIDQKRVLSEDFFRQILGELGFREENMRCGERPKQRMVWV